MVRRRHRRLAERARLGADPRAHLIQPLAPAHQDGRPNYDTVSISIVEQALTKAKLPHNIVVDCSHANSFKKPELQPLVMADIVNQIRLGKPNKIYSYKYFCDFVLFF